MIKFRSQKCNAISLVFCQFVFYVIDCLLLCSVENCIMQILLSISHFDSVRLDLGFSKSSFCIYSFNLHIRTQ